MARTKKSEVAASGAQQPVDAPAEKKARAPNGWNTHVKSNFKSVKDANPGKSQSELMKILSEGHKKTKSSSAEAAGQQ